MTQFALKDFSQIDRGSTIKSPVLRVLACVRDGLSLPEIVKTTGFKRHRVRYALETLAKLNLIDLPKGYPVIPVLLIAFKDAEKITFERFEKKNGMVPVGITGSKVVSLTNPKGEARVANQVGGGRATLSKVPIASPAPVVLSKHRVKVRFRLRGRLPRECDRKGVNGRKYWYLRDSSEGGACVEGGKRHVFVSVFGLRGNSTAELNELAVKVAVESLKTWVERYGVRVDSQGELCGGAHFVIENEVIAKRLKGLLNLEKSVFQVESGLGLAKWYSDKSHSRKVEVSGAGAEEQVESFVFLVTGGIQRELSETREALVSLGGNVGDLGKEFKGFVKRFDAPRVALSERDKELKGYG